MPPRAAADATITQLRVGAQAATGDQHEPNRHRTWGNPGPTFFCLSWKLSRCAGLSPNLQSRWGKRGDLAEGRRAGGDSAASDGQDRCAVWCQPDPPDFPAARDLRGVWLLNLRTVVRKASVAKAKLPRGAQRHRSERAPWPAACCLWLPAIAMKNAFAVWLAFSAWLPSTPRMDRAPSVLCAFPLYRRSDTDFVGLGELLKRALRGPLDRPLFSPARRAHKTRRQSPQAHCFGFWRWRCGSPAAASDGTNACQDGVGHDLFCHLGRRHHRQARDDLARHHLAAQDTRDCPRSHIRAD